jgi:3-deoxy-D-manno-octulosonic-acid transferase
MLNRHIPIISRLKLWMFSTIEAIASRAKKSSTTSIIYHPENSLTSTVSENCLWVYASTIGELNAISILIDELILQEQYSQLVILTDHPHYQKPMSHLYPKAVILDHGVNGSFVISQIKRYRPALFLIAEIPCVMFDAPCRLSARIIYACKSSGARISIVNGWIYNESASCRMDTIEEWLLGKDVNHLIDDFFMQREQNAKTLLELGIHPSKVSITGNLKFDAVDIQPFDRIFKAQISTNENRPIITCGCVTNIDEQEIIIDAFKRFKSIRPDCLLIIAPRHPERADRMKILKDILSDLQLNFIFRTEQSHELESNIDVLVLNTIGELKRFYAIADICYVGVNHNILEPLSFSRPTLITDGWNPQYPSFPVYQALKNTNAVKHTTQKNAESISQLFKQLIEDHSVDRSQTIMTAIGSLQGSLQNHMQRLKTVTKEVATG